jgi:hypothetical protein
MSFFSKPLLPEVLRSLAFSGVSGTYAKIGTPTLHPWRVLFISNTTDADMIISFDGVNDHMVIPTTQNASIDISANGLQGQQFVRQGTQFWVKQVSAPTKGSVYVAGFYT